ncbi:MAG: transposase [candidate division KSB1 bacterium]|nr:transposase [candidate division KSB1 bacterium]
MEATAPQPTYDELLAEEADLKAELAQLRRLIFGQKRERRVKISCELLNPLSEALRDEILRQPYLMADETPMRVLNSSQPGKCHLGYHWVYYAPLVKLAYFDYQPSRRRDGPQSRCSGIEKFCRASANRRLRSLRGDYPPAGGDGVGLHGACAA